MIMATPDTPSMDAAPVKGAIGLVVGATGETPPVEATAVELATPETGTGVELQAYSVTVTVLIHCYYCEKKSHSNSTHSVAEAPIAITAATTAKILNCILTVGVCLVVWLFEGEDLGGGVKRVEGLK
jgi:hypothetical protein